MTSKRRTKLLFFELFKIYHVQRFLLVAFGLVSISSGLIPVLEKTSPEANILNFQDGVWWALVTVTSTGFGDFYPVTLGGRVIGVILMFSGIALFSVVIALIASYFSHKRIMFSAKRTNQRLELVEKKMEAIDAKLDFLVKSETKKKEK